MDTELLWKLLDSIQTQIKAFDAKAQVAIGVDSLLAGLLATEIAKSADFVSVGMKIRLGAFIAMSVLSLFCVGLSFIFALKTIHPQLHLKQPTSRFFFCHLSHRYKRNYRKAAEELSNMSEAEVKTEIGTQILTVAIICGAKAARCRIALLACGVALGAYLLTIYPLCSIAFEIAGRKH